MDEEIAVYSGNLDFEAAEQLETSSVKNQRFLPHSVCGDRCARRRCGFLAHRPRHTLVLRFICHRQRGATRPQRGRFFRCVILSDSEESQRTDEILRSRCSLRMTKGRTQDDSILSLSQKSKRVLTVSVCGVLCAPCRRLRCTQTAAHTAPVLNLPLAAHRLVALIRGSLCG